MNFFIDSAFFSSKSPLYLKTSRYVLTADKELENYTEKCIKLVEKRRLQVETIHQVGNESSASLFPRLKDTLVHEEVGE